MSWIYEETSDNTSRFVLGTQGSRPLICFGINSSAAAPECLDNTLKPVERIALNNNNEHCVRIRIFRIIGLTGWCKGFQYAQNKDCRIL